MSVIDGLLNTIELLNLHLIEMEVEAERQRVNLEIAQDKIDTLEKKLNNPKLTGAKRPS